MIKIGSGSYSYRTRFFIMHSTSNISLPKKVAAPKKYRHYSFVYKKTVPDIPECRLFVAAKYHINTDTAIL